MRGTSTGGQLPSRHAVARFFRERKACSVAFAAELTGSSIADIRRRVLRGDMSLEGGLIAWEDVALGFEAAWSMAIKEELVRGVDGYPALLRAFPVTWLLPAYLVIALEQQVARAQLDDPRGARLLSVESFATEELRLRIDEKTVAELRGSVAFREAYFFPEKP